jgi:hypothetical protein
MYKKLSIKLSILTLTLFVSACSKTSDDIKVADLSGSYKGNINTYMNGTLSQTLNNHTIVLVPTTVVGQVTITNNVIISTSGKISGNTLTIPKSIVASNQSFSVSEYGTGTFSGNKLTIEFYQDQVSPNGSISTVGKWTGVLTKL